LPRWSALAATTTCKLNPLADRSDRQHFVHQRGDTLHHAASAAPGAESSPLAGEGYQHLVMAALTADSEKQMFQPSTIQVVAELLLYLVGQGSAFGFQVGE